MRLGASLFLTAFLLLILSQFRLQADVPLYILLIYIVSGLLFGILFNSMTMKYIREYGFTTRYKDTNEEKKQEWVLLFLLL